MTRPYLKHKLDLDSKLITEARELARNIVAQLTPFILSHSTDSIERAVLRLLGINNIDENGVPLPNIIVEHLKKLDLLKDGAARTIVRACLQHQKSPQEIAELIALNQIDLENLNNLPEEDLINKLQDLISPSINKIKAQKYAREFLLQKTQPPEPYLYVIVATGNIYEDVLQARAAARQGADIIAVIRSTGQSLLDYVPYGPTTEGFGGTFATQENFKIMRTALDEVGQELGRYIRLTNYCSGLCMPEIAVMGALERLDVMLNDSMYGIIFRDINMQRTLIDQYFSRLINGFAGIVINTGEDNYLTTTDALEAGHTVLASNFINEQFAFLSKIPEELLGLGHAMEINPEQSDSFLMEIAQAQLIREIFPCSPIKYMPPTKYMTGNIFRGQVQDTLFNAASIMTGQSIHLLGILTEGIHTPLLQDRFLSIEAAKLAFKAMRSLEEEITFTPGGQIQERAQTILTKAVIMLKEICDIGLFEALGKGMFADISRSPQGGRGLEGVFRKSSDYLNQIIEILNQGSN